VDFGSKIEKNISPGPTFRRNKLEKLNMMRGDTQDERNDNRDIDESME